MPAGVRQAASERARDPARDSASRPNSDARGPRIGPYCLRRRLPGGSGAAVWHALAPDGGDRAIKIVELGSDSPATISALEREREVLATLAHPGICRALDWVDSGNRRALVLEYLAGGDLVSLAGGPAWHWLAALGQVATTLGFLHESGFVHRDVKARNVRFDRADRPKLIDFGSCERAGGAWHAEGTTAEHRRPGWVGRETSPGDDVYAFAALCHEMLYGHPPAGGDRGDRQADPATASLESLVERTLALTPDRCNGSLRDFAAVIEYLEDGELLR